MSSNQIQDFLRLKMRTHGCYYCVFLDKLKVECSNRLITCGTEVSQLELFSVTTYSVSIVSPT